MFGWNQKNNKEDKELVKLIVALRRVKKPVFDSVDKERIWAHIQSKIIADKVENRDILEVRGLVSLGRRIGEAGKKVLLSRAEKAKMKEKILSFIENSLFFKSASVRPVMRYFRQTVSAVLLLVFWVGSVFMLPYHVPVTYAMSTYLEDLTGEVLILRDGITVQAQPKMSLREGDTVLTKAASSATVHFADDSVSRVGEKSDLELKQLGVGDRESSETRIEMYLKQGQVWSRVFNMLEDKTSFAIGTHLLSANVSKKAVFDVYADREESKVAVFDNVVDVVSEVSEVKQISPVLAGYQVKVKSRDEQLSVQATVPVNEINQQWVAENLKKDVQYDQKVSEKVKNDVLNEAVKDEKKPKLIVFDDKDMEQLKADFIAQTKVIADAKILFVKGDYKSGAQSLQSYRVAMRKITEMIPELQKRNAFDTEVLRKTMCDQVLQQLKDLAPVIPGDSLYPVKEVLEDMQLMLAPDDLQMVDLRLAHAEVKLLEIQALLKKGDIALAYDGLAKYKNEVDKVVVKIKPEEYEVLSPKLVDLVNRQVEQIKVLVVIENTSRSTEQAEFSVQVGQLRASVLKGLLSALEKLQTKVPKEKLIELKMVFESYVESNRSDTDLVVPVLEQLIAGSTGEIISFVQPDASQVPSEVGLVMIVTEDATPDVREVFETEDAVSVQPQKSELNDGSIHDNKPIDLKWGDKLNALDTKQSEK